jgi:hypothetical protein
VWFKDIERKNIIDSCEGREVRGVEKKGKYKNIQTTNTFKIHKTRHIHAFLFLSM